MRQTSFHFTSSCSSLWSHNFIQARRSSIQRCTLTGTGAFRSWYLPDKVLRELEDTVCLVILISLVWPRFGHSHCSGNTLSFYLYIKIFLSATIIHLVHQYFQLSSSCLEVIVNKIRLPASSGAILVMIHDNRWDEFCKWKQRWGL